MSKPGFTILTATYNNARFLGDWHASIIAQKYRPLDVVLVDDCSTDDTKEKIRALEKSFAKHDIGFRFIANTTRKYCASTYKIATAAAKTPFFGILDSDDKITDDAVEYVMGLYEAHPDIAWIYTQFDRYDANFVRRKGKGLSRAPDTSSTLLHLGVKRVHAYSHWRTFSNRVPEIPMSIWKDGLRSAVDKYMGYRLEEMGNGLFADRVCYLYRQGVDSAISHTEPAVKVWYDIVTEAANRRRRQGFKNGLTPYPIRALI